MTRPGGRRRAAGAGRPGCEGLERRDLLTITPGYDYLLSGNQWADPGAITDSIAPDGVHWDGGVNNINTTLGASLGAAAWRREAARALATWEDVANIDISPTHDGAFDEDAPGLSQGDPRFGDIRFGGYSFPRAEVAAQSYFPPPDGATSPGDVEVNTSVAWQVGTGIDFYSVMLHETGLTLGLAEPPSPDVVMARAYGGVRTGLTAGDIAGIRAIYGPRPADAYASQGRGVSPATAVDVTPGLAADDTATLAGLGLTTIGGVEYFSVTAPASAAGAALSVTAGASGISLLSPKLSILDASGAVLDTAGDPSAWSDDATARVASVTAGHAYLIAVTGATSDAFAIGSYQLKVSFPGSTPPPASPPVIASPPVVASPPVTASPPVISAPPVVPNPPVVATPAPPATPVAAAPAPAGSSGATANPTPTPPAQASDDHNATIATATPLGTLGRSPISVPALTLDAASDVDDFTFRAGRAGTIRVLAPGTAVTTETTAGVVLSRGLGSATVRSRRAGTSYVVTITPPGGVPVPHYSLTLAGPGAVIPRVRTATRAARATALAIRKPTTRRVP